MVCTRKTKTLVSTCVILSGMTNIICLLYVGWVTNYIASVYVRGQEPSPDKKLEEDKGDTLKIIERLDHLENVIKQHIQGTDALGNLGRPLGQCAEPRGVRWGWCASIERLRGSEAADA
ncbi:putative polypeptide N-acetylgalactosaminyltransferase-like protein 4 [Camelus ferus]|nr:putative polypeptide N-acetylgalactosaminyltransferase-like protein 4 [Camelus ferus]